ncbi:MAG: 2-oxoglutarate dehydrogenase, E2 component, dihydrolipoamide succinyltransferase [Acidobacteria bacterium]|nr:MAG: 2-oxoglutarate dehydrogenase, E2 component, dihydrolipoamide succinyltransferase [Acidobacteriota bacterium]REJ99006.1 MAG: 2-oxoglutarate dehydrogenase, E2 component, dihydrolipoamide succinyltransferase [Acidobacteriota bacterium]REK16274.1 MAG: 2-oxoglutarate dehydrogenase, E2 component, dihydrolipoamide succinyltransferase [Acidobacteriota bacterium]REK43955.1 MAG: 2-oxoglutarate dehydrogenase, E2 component, dihydrolipoamide succinyltransferase [Acidobacteriota bacterium]
MSVEVVMPQMGESIAEGTISKWLKQVGETVERDEPLLEISTDKVDAEVPAPAAGVLLEIRAQEGDTVEVDSVVAVLGEEGEVSADDSSSAEAAAPPAEEVVEESPEPESVAEPEPEPTSAPAPAPSASSDTATEVVMPQMGESIAEGTISKWLKSVGDKVERDEALLEISTDKVDAEVPSPVEGTLLEIKYQEGDTVEVDTVLALIGAEGAKAPPAPSAEAPAPVATEEPEAEKPATDSAPKAVSAAAAPSNGHDKPRSEMTLEELRKTKSSPLVRNIAKEHNVDISQIEGTGMSGRVTKKDILAFIDSGAAVKPEDLMAKPATQRAPQVEPASVPAPSKAEPVSAPPAPRVAASSEDRIESMSVMRKKIAEHMTFSKQTSAHVTSVYEFDMTNVVKYRDRHKREFQERYGTKLTFMPFIFEATTAALREFPVVNSQVAGDQVVYKGDINLGMAVALDWGLIVPVIRQADQLSLAGLARSANDLADRARAKKLNPDEVQGGTFTITNPGVFGGLFGTPIINQPQVAILCVGTIEKRPKVMTTPDGDDFLGIRSMAYFALTYDHRIVDGADAEQFLSFMKNYLENTDFRI